VAALRAMPRPPRARCAIIGLGRIGSTLEDDRLREIQASHAGAVRGSPDCVLAAGCDLEAGRRAAFTRRWGRVRVYGDAGEMLARETPDILHIATPAESHLELVRLAAARRVPVVVCEKPLALNAGDAREAVRECRRAGSALLVNHERRYSRDYRQARLRVEEGRYGELLSLSARLYMGRGRPAGDILWSDGTHLLDAIRFLTGGEIQVLQVAGQLLEGPGVFQALCRAGRVPVSLEVSGGCDALVFELDLAFARGRLRIGNGLYEEWGSEPSPWYEGFRSLRQRRVRRFRRTGYFTGLVADAVAVLRSPGRVPLSSGEDGLAAVEAVEALRAAARLTTLPGRPCL